MNTCDANGGESTGKIRLSSSSAQKCISINCCKCHIDLLCASERTAWTNPDISRQALSSRVWWLRPIKRFDGENRLAASSGRRRSDRQRERMRETAAAECNCRALEPASRRRRERMTMHALMPIRLGPPAADRSPLDHGRHRPRPNATTIDSPLSGARAAAPILRAR